MAGSQPYPIQSPTQSARFVPYSPTSKAHNYNYEQYHPPSQTPPAFPPATLAQSPHFGHPVTLSSPPTTINGNGQPSEVSSQYHAISISPHHQPSHSYSGLMTGTKGHSPYANVQPSHAHPSSRQNSLTLSPTREFVSAANHQRLNMVSSGNTGNTSSATQPSRPTSQEVMT